MVIHVYSSVLEWPEEGSLFKSDQNKRQGGGQNGVTIHVSS